MLSTRVSSSPCLTDTCQEFNLRANALEISSYEPSTSYDASQQAHSFRCNQSTKVNPQLPSPDQSQSASNAYSNSNLNKKHKLLLIYHHALTCRKDNCSIQYCNNAKKTLNHIIKCNGVNCKENCINTRNLIAHYKGCKDDKCDTCGPVREAIRLISKKVPKVSGNSNNSEAGLKRVNSHNLMHCNNNNSEGLTKDFDAKKKIRVKFRKDIEPKDQGLNSKDCVVKEARKEFNGENVNNRDLSVKEPNDESVKIRDLSVKEPNDESVKSRDLSVKEPNDESLKPSTMVPTCEFKENKDLIVNEPVNNTKDESVKMEIDSNKYVENRDLNVNMAIKESIKDRVRGASLLDTFTIEEIKIHLDSLKQSDNKMEIKNEQIQELDQNNTCSLCNMEELLFAPPPRYCAKCSVQIASHGVYYSTDNTTSGIANTTSGFESGIAVSLCSRCYNVSGECVKLKTRDMHKWRFKKQLNYAETDADSEWWVQCSKCEAWQHQVCALFNGRRKEAKYEYTCANCFLNEIKNGECETLDPIRVLGAKDLPKTELSDHVENWLKTRLQIEREERAIMSKKNVDEVPGVEGLCVRVVSSVDRVVNVQPQFLDFMKDQYYPSQFPYKSKAILLFQKIEGVDVCLFAMYVQEYGSKCKLPNQRHVYISYIDSVKYFQPEIRSSSGEALRTFVYHQLLIGYLDYCKKRGFASCSIWACPPTKHDDYILYCHPTAQKMPKAEKLRSWYQVMINRAVKEKVVIERTNLYDYYLIPTNDSKINISSAHLPYCDNDFWPGEAERILSDKKAQSGAQKKVVEQPKGRAVRAAKRGLVEGKPDDILLLHKLGERMRSLKEDFIMIFLQPTCKHCRRAIISATKWVCDCCKNFLLCDQCYSEEEELPDKDKHPAGLKLKHTFHKVVGPALPATDDPDPLMECEYFDSRIDLLRLCQTNTYQFDSLRRAKHSTMMILHYLHTPSCASCHDELDNEVDRWRCPICRGFNVCLNCYSRDGAVGHSHELVRSNGTDTGTGTSSNLVKKRKKFTKEVMEDLVHASRCMETKCRQGLCLNLKLLFVHGSRCKIRRWHCIKCTKMWQLMVLHSRTCHSLECQVPRCRDLKNHERKLHAIRSRMKR